MNAPNYMVFYCALLRYRHKTRGTPAFAAVCHASEKALASYKAKDYVMAEQWRNAAHRTSLDPYRVTL